MVAAWHVPNTQVGKVWCDASSLALGIALEVQGSIVEDAVWLRKSTDCALLITAFKTHGAAEMLIKRRLAVFAELIATFDLRVTHVCQVRGQSSRRSDQGEKIWLQAEDNELVCAASVGRAAWPASLWSGTDPLSVYVARLVNPTLARAATLRA